MKKNHRKVVRFATIVFICFLLLSPSLARAQTSLAQKTPAISPELRDQLQTIRDVALKSDYAWQQLAHLTENIGPRLAGSAGAQAAVEYVGAELKRLGLEVRLEPAQVSHWVRGEEKGELTEYPGQFSHVPQRIVLTALSGSSATPADGLTAEVVVVHSFEELTALGAGKVAGKIVLYNVPYDERKALAGSAFQAYGEAVVYRTDGAKAAVALGAVASLIRSVGGANFRLPHTGFSTPTAIPAAALAAEDADLVDHLAAAGPRAYAPPADSANASQRYQLQRDR